MAKDYSPLGLALKVKASPTIPEMEQALRALFQSDKLELVEAVLDDCQGKLEWFDAGEMRITIDPFRCLLGTLAHELMHETRRRQLASWGQMEEAINMTADDLIQRYINRSKARVGWWRTAYKNKVVS